MGEGYFLPLTVWGMLGFRIQPWGDQVLLFIISSCNKSFADKLNID